MQSLTPRERLEFLQDQVDSLTALREKFEVPISGNPENARSPFDLDVLHARDPENIRRLLRACEELDSMGGGQFLNLLGTIGKSRTWGDLLTHCGTVEIDPETIVRVLDLETLITVKEKLGAPKDVAMLPVFREALKEQKGRRPPPKD